MTRRVIQPIMSALFLLLRSLLQPHLAMADGTTDPKVWTLNRIIQKAAESSPQLNRLNKEIEQAESKALQAGLWDNPDLAFLGGPMNTGKQLGAALDLSLRQTVPLFGQVKINETLEKQNVRIAESDWSIRALAIQHEVVRLSYRLAATLEQSKHISHRRERAALITRFLKSRPFASPSQRVEVNLVQNRLREIEEKFLDISANKEKLWQALNVFLDLPEPITPQIEWITSPQEENLQTLTTSVATKNLELLRQEKVIQAADLSIAKASKQAYPNIRIGLGVNNQTVGIPQYTYTGIIELSLPVINRGQYTSQAAQARKEIETFRITQKRRELSAELGSAWADWVRSRKQINLFPLSLVPSLEDQMDRTESDWKKGLVNVAAFLELENQVHDQAVKVYEAQTLYVEALSRVLYLSGLDFKITKR